MVRYRTSYAYLCFGQAAAKGHQIAEAVRHRQHPLPLGNMGPLAFQVGPDKLIFSLGELTGNVWMLGPDQPQEEQQAAAAASRRSGPTPVLPLPRRWSSGKVRVT